ncbi:haloacid dehalogenase [Mesorhizobium sp. Root554]|uniref:HAD family hydrolase n=1 Tax=unclassified Mesorhizobium TaxID=325217 RepID=UPI0006F51571|nr:MULTISPECIES: HAD-IA family hydrolase [unclassified Mesorhizobium]KQZ15124.1 haloacid dehalogenase [Mesorhizobium sp. Root1471]KQZ38562.1 haloacid dehalogenase [Mesorhizobium sp. Root554]
MTTAKQLSGKRLAFPRALLLDFGGVIVETTRIVDWENRLAEKVETVLDRAGARVALLSRQRIVADIQAGCIADSHWKNAMSRTLSPPELTYEQFWGEFVGADWPADAREAVLAEARELCRRMGHLRSDRKLRDGMQELLERCDAASISVGIVSNALSGQVHLDFLDDIGWTDRFAVKIHSDEVKVRKPNPEMIWLACREIGVDAGDAWYVGDNFDRDVLCGVRAGIGGNILMEAKGTYDMPYDLGLKPDAIVATPRHLLALLEQLQTGKVA